MPHADTSLVPSSISTKTEFWEYVYTQLESLIGGQGNWVSNLSNTASLIYHSLQSFRAFGSGEGAVNWCGFYLDASIPPSKSLTTGNTKDRILYLGPFSGRPACQQIVCRTGRGVCADAYLQRQTLVVPNVNEYPGHIACDGQTKSEIVIPMLQKRGDAEQGEIVALGVMDLDCLAFNGFDEEDKIGLERIVQLLVTSCDWGV
ncbi:hypothetical protein FRB99_003071 [Tulasnella sp. 403]|nr:hypothetical protein FRB99_003071 [Tulasnella sp. 403]